MWKKKHVKNRRNSNEKSQSRWREKKKKGPLKKVLQLVFEGKIFKFGSL